LAYINGANIGQEVMIQVSARKMVKALISTTPFL
jgi:hypothetical protein